MTKQPKTIIGRTLRVSFPELGLQDVEAKIDTGAYRGALHCSSIELFRKAGTEHLSFTPLDDSHPGFARAPILFSAFATTKVKNTSGSYEPRYVIKTVVVIDGKSYPIELTLTDRANMKTPILIGRKFLRNKFVVDVASKAG